jgi:hypothetical protein
VAILKSATPAVAAAAGTNPVEPSEKKPCFVISPIGPEDSETRKRADQVLRHIIKKGLSDTYAVERADDISKPGLITLQIIERLMKAPMVVADLTDANANVYYELAIRHFVKKPVVHLIAEGQKPPFDVAQMRYISYDLTNPDSVESAARDVREHAAACERGEVPFTPIQFVEMLDTARGEGENQFVALALGIQSALSNLQSDVLRIDNKVTYLTEAELNERISSGLFGTQHPYRLSPSTLANLAATSSGRLALSDLALARATWGLAQKERPAGPKTGQAEPTGTPIAPAVTLPKDEK